MKPLFILIFLISCVNLLSQNFKIKYDPNQNLYLYQQNFYKFNELKPLVSIHADSKKLWDRYHSIKLAGNLAMIGGSTIATAGFFLPKNDEFGCEFFCNPQRIYMIITGIAATITGSIINISNDSNNRPRIIETYNAHYSDDFSKHSQKAEFYLIVGNEIGLQIRF